jgi:hypothetical protein
MPAHASPKQINHSHFTGPIAVTWLSATKATLTTCMTGICIMCMTILGGL